MERANIVIIGGGVIGLSIAAELSKNNEGVFIFEKNKRTGQEASSHNSGVIHSGIHYPRNSLKARLCISGNSKLYEICRENGIQYKRLGKLTVANGDSEIKEIEKLRKQGEENGVEGLEILEGAQVRKIEPGVTVDQALYSPSSGIVEPDELMSYYQSRTRINGGVIATETEVKSIRAADTGYEITAVAGLNKFELLANTIINAAGLFSDRIAAMVGIDVDRMGYRLHPCKGDYFRVSGNPPVKRLVYPVPKGAGLGIHLTPDLSGSIKLGPNSYYVKDISYNVESSIEEFRNDVRRYLPSIANREILEDSSGVRPKLQGPNDGFRDFVIKEEGELGYPSFINLIGIESPGLTAAPAIAEYVAEMYSDSRH
ncbi:MAG: NAD(P)/FAD-dependent oxidoreductase [Thermoplasmatales archaeon]|jgi:L-2-hydroxyglutarate oxidase LhgO|nr:NAD(P)/FAD-dependent oxidoreductase [Candidatus Thermoplasmatota archaeon]MCL6002042.1 NAD(P)/FAD-dependent oxidoreductase [Candidatus Thermoplasmatota archaeon]MDA8054615.1 NAD(P)/FAD-dependent oxidoreductase [Thermoplasmatales archaeon]